MLKLMRFAAAKNLWQRTAKSAATQEEIYTKKVVSNLK